MKSRALLVAAAAILMAYPAFADDASNVFSSSQGPDQHLAKDTLIGAKVYGKDGTIIGDIEDLILSDGNTVVGVIMGTGGFLGLAEKRVGINLEALESSQKDGQTIISVPLTHEDLVAASAYQRSQPQKSLLERAREKAKELTDKTTETTKDAYEAAKPTIDKAKEEAKDAYEKAKEKVQDAVGGESKPAEQPAPEATPPPAPEATPAPAPEPAPAPAPEAATPAPKSPPAPEAAPAPPAEPAPAPESTPAPSPAPEPSAAPESTPAPTPEATPPPAPDAPAPSPQAAPAPDQPPATETPAEPPAQQ